MRSLAGAPLGAVLCMLVVVTPAEEVVVHLNRMVTGWANYFSYGTVSKAHRVVDRYAADRLRRFLVRRHKVGGLGTRQFPDTRLYREYGLRQLAPSGAW